ncbi:MAG: cell division protein FtsQ/DivIB [Candidatus Pacebacteria bacterium]|nr:cell division protein FtsQ/DivIB [Candidatus Paceibacterota bacterium]
MQKLPKEITRKSLRKKKSRGKIKLLLFLFIFLIILGGLIYLFGFSGVFKIKNIGISNKTQIADQDLIDIIKAHLAEDHWSFLPRDSWPLIAQGAIVQEILDKYPQIRTASLKIQLPKMSLEAIIEPRTPVALWCDETQEKCSLVDDEGIIFQTATKEQYGTELPLIISKINNSSDDLGKKVYSAEDIRQVIRINQNLKEDLQIPLESFIADDTSFLVADTKEGWEIYFDLDSNLDISLMKLKALLDQELPINKRQGLQYIDLRFTKVYYK